MFWFVNGPGFFSHHPRQETPSFDVLLLVNIFFFANDFTAP
jgi:hypothetical protein